MVSESGRETHGKPRFKYACPNAVRKGTCDYVAVHGVEMDEYIVSQLSAITDSEDDFYISQLKSQIDETVQSDQTEREIREIRRGIDSLERNIKSQVKTMRQATASVREYLMADVEAMTTEIAEKKKRLDQLENKSSDGTLTVKNYEQIRNLLISFEEQAKECEPEELISLIRTVIERVYVTRDGKEEKCHIFIKGCKKEDYDDFFVCSDTSISNLTNESAEMCDSERYREYCAHQGRYPAAVYLRPHNESAGTRGADRKSQDHTRI